MTWPRYFLYIPGSLWSLNQTFFTPKEQIWYFYLEHAFGICWRLQSTWLWPVLQCCADSLHPFLAPWRVMELVSLLPLYLAMLYIPLGYLGYRARYRYSAGERCQTYSQLRPLLRWPPVNPSEHPSLVKSALGLLIFCRLVCAKPSVAFTNQGILITGYSLLAQSQQGRH